MQLKQMAFYVINPEGSLFDNASDQAKEDPEEEEKIEETISQDTAEQMLSFFKELKVKKLMKVKAGQIDNTAGELAKIDRESKDWLFIKFNQSPDFIEKAWKHYGLNVDITPEDEERFKDA